MHQDPTSEMIEAGIAALEDLDLDATANADIVEAVYRAMRKVKTDTLFQATP